MEQTATTCGEHDECTVITCVNGDGDVVWTSHAPADLAIEERANDDYPDVADETGAGQ